MAHIKGTAGIGIHENGIAPAADKKRMCLVGILCVCGQRILLPAVQQLSAFIQICKLLPESPECFIGV